MPIQIILAALALAVSVPLLWVSVAAARAPKSSLVEGITDARSLVLQQGAGERVARPMLRSLGATLSRFTPQSWIDSMRRTLELGGYAGRYSLERMLVAKFAVGAGFAVLGAFLEVGQLSRGNLLLIAGAGLTGYFIPNFFVSRTARIRQERIQLELPDTLDQIRMTVDAGLGFDAAVARTARAGEGPLAEELTRLLREMQLGMSRTDAFRGLAARTDVADLDSFVIAVVQSQSYGIPVVNVLRVQSDELRDKRRQRAEERALKIPVLLIFPLALCIFPAMFVVLLGPAAIRIFRDLGPAIGS